MEQRASLPRLALSDIADLVIAMIGLFLAVAVLYPARLLARAARGFLAGVRD